MRPQSIIGLIVAALMVVGGLILCLVAGNMAESTGVQLFTKVENGTTQFVEKEFTKTKIEKIELNVRNVDVNIIGGQEKSYVEFWNYDDKYYIYSESGKTITVSELKDKDSLIRFWENGFSFKGIRNVLSSVLGIGEQITGKKVINIYLSNESEALKNIELIMGTGNVTVTNVTTKTDFVFSMTSGSVTCTGITNSSKLEVVSDGELTLSLDTCKFSNLLVNSAADNNTPVPTGHFSLKNIKIGASDITLNAGDVSIDSLAGQNTIESWILNITSTDGKVVANGKNCGSSYTYTGRFSGDTNSRCSLTIVSENAEVTITQPSWNP